MINQDKPLVLANDPNGVTGQPIIQRLRAGRNLNIPLEERFQQLSVRFNLLITYLLEEGFQFPVEVLEEENN